VEIWVKYEEVQWSTVEYSEYSGGTVSTVGTVEYSEYEWVQWGTGGDEYSEITINYSENSEWWWSTVSPGIEIF
jgi:hypothetical protein